jgi:glycosidase
MEERGHFEWTKDAVIYEVNIRQYTEEGTIEAFMPHMERLKEMGVDILWVMPIHPVGEKNRKGSLGSYYSVKDYKAVNPEFGTFEDFTAMVMKAHNLGMKVMLDWVANHTAWDHVWAYTNPEYYTKTEEGEFFSPYDWSDVIELDYDNREMRDSMIDALAFWVREAKIDGYRCDVAGLVPTDFWDEARAALEQIKPVFMLAEDEDNPDLLRYAFDMNYAWKVHHLMNRIVKKEASPADLISHFHWNDSLFGHQHYRMNFITNHDENSWNGTVFERLGDGVEAFAVFSFMIPGMPLIYSGQEAGLDKRLRFFEKDTINWSNIRYQEFYTRLIGFKKSHSALHNGRFGAPMEILPTQVPDQLFAFVRKNHEGTIVSVFNFSDKPATGTILNRHDLHGDYTELFSGERVALDQGIQLSFPAWGYKVLYIKY